MLSESNDMQDKRNILQHNSSSAIYCRTSRDKTGLNAGVKHQEVDCRPLAERPRLTVDRVLVNNDISAYSGNVNNDISAYSGKPRPTYNRLLELMQSSQIGMVLAFHQDRLQHRR